MDVTKYRIPVTDIEIFQLPVNAAEISFLLTHIANAVESQQGETPPILVRLQSKLAFFFALVLAVGAEKPEERQEAEQRVQQIYEELKAQKEAMESEGGKS